MLHLLDDPDASVKEAARGWLNLGGLGVQLARQRRRDLVETFLNEQPHTQAELDAIQVVLSADGMVAQRAGGAWRVVRQGLPHEAAPDAR